MMYMRIPSKVRQWLLLSVTFLSVAMPASAKAVEVGDTEAKVLAELGEPSMKMNAGSQGVIWAYGRGDVIVRNGKVIKVDLVTQEVADHKASVEAGARARILRWKSYKESTMAVLFNPLNVQPADERSEIGISEAGIRPAYEKIPVFNYEEQEIGYSSSRGSSMQSVGGGGGISPGGQAPTVKVRVPPFSETKFVGAKLSWTVNKPLRAKFTPAAYLVNFFDRTRGEGYCVAIPIDQVKGLRKDGNWTTARLSVVISLEAGSKVERAFAESDGLLLIPGEKGKGEDYIAMGCEGKSWLPATREPVK